MTGTRPITRGALAREPLAHPLVVIIALPALVLALGIFLILAARAALHASLVEMARIQFREQIRTARDQLDATLGGSDVILGVIRDRLALDQGAATLEQRGGLLRSLIQPRGELAWVSWSTAGGDFLGLQRRADGALQLSVNRWQRPGRSQLHEYLVGADGSLTQVKEDLEHTYDPRQRPFWAQAVASETPVWTRPYAFYEGAAGVTIASAVRSPAGELLGVATVDFSFGTLSSLMRVIASRGGGTMFLVSADHQVLAWPGTVRHPAGDDVGPRLMTVDQLADPGAKALLASPRGASDTIVTYRDAAGEEFLGTLAPVHIGEDQHWWVGAYAPMRGFIGPTERFHRRALVIAAAGVGSAMLLAALLARLVLRSRERVRRAKEALRAADAKARELGSYHLTRRIGVGGMGEVWIGEHRLLARQAAIKLILRHSLAGQGEEQAQRMIARFEFEAQVTASLRCRNTVQIYDFGISERGDFFYVMELLDGFDLQRLVDRHGPQPIARVIAIGRQACRSLAEAHDRGLIHRDIKPANIHCCRIGDECDVVKVLDFGMVADIGQRLGGEGRLTTPGMVNGTPGYMAPEQATGKELDARSDLYALGCVLWFLLTGREVFPNPDPLAVLMAHLNDPPPRPGQRRAGIPAELESVVMSCLAKDRAQRPADARALERALAAVPVAEAWDEAAAQAWWQAHAPLVATPEPAFRRAGGPRQLRLTGGPGG